MERDQYGFVIKPGSKKESEKKVTKTKYTWDAVLKKHNGDISNLKLNSHLYDLIVRDGIPPNLRGKVRKIFFHNLGSIIILIHIYYYIGLGTFIRSK